MEREWAELSAAISRVDAEWRDSTRLSHRTAVIVRVHLWAVVHDRPTSWACDPANWPPRARPACLPDQSTVSRRTRRGPHARAFEACCAAVGRAVAGPAPVAGGPALAHKVMDGTALEVAMHSKDRDARVGRGAGQLSKGYKLHLIFAAGGAMPARWAVTPLNVDERAVACRLVGRLTGGGYLLADAMYDMAELHRRAAAAGDGHQLVCPRGKPGTGLGHRPQDPARLRSIQLTEPPPGTNGFGPALHAERRRVEQAIAHLTSFGAGLKGLPAWARRIWRVRHWVHGKLLVNAARIKRLARARA
jgi:hypothetical protein